MKIRHKISLIIITIVSIMFIPPNIAAFTCNTLEIKDIQCHVMGISFFDVQFKTNVYEWFELTDSYPCGGVLAHPDKAYDCMGIEDYWGLPSQLSPSAERERIVQSEENDLRNIYDVKENAMYYQINNHTTHVEINIPFDKINGVFQVEMNGNIIDDQRISIIGDKIIIDFDDYIKSVKLYGVTDL